MADALPSLLTSWQSFYVIVGSSGAALTGLQFVVIALVADQPRRASTTEIDAFGTPTIVHFGAVLLIAAMLSAPWTGLTSVGVLLALVGLFGVVYTVVILRRARRQTGYRPVFEDWLWHMILPFVAYAVLTAAGLLLPHHPTQSLFTTAAVSLLLLFIGIHNSWDTVTFLAISRNNAATKPGKGAPKR